MYYSVHLVCQDCGKSFDAKRRDAKRCDVCATAARAIANRSYQRARRASEPKPLPLQCVDCGAPVDAKRKDAQRCEACKAKRKLELSRKNPRRVPITAHQCTLCGRPFEAARKNSRRCPDCLAARVALEPKSVVVCIDCGTEFKAKTTLARRCPTCKTTRRTAYVREYEKGKRRGECIDCGASIGKRALHCHLCDNKARSEYMHGERLANWKGGRSEQKGYSFVRTETESGKRVYRGEHIIVWEKTHGKPLLKGWVVHHLNGDKLDNRPENLVGLPRHQHHSHPREALVPYEGRIRELEAELNKLQQLQLREPEQRP